MTLGNVSLYKRLDASLSLQQWRLKFPSGYRPLLNLNCSILAPNIHLCVSIFIFRASDTTFHLAAAKTHNSFFSTIKIFF